MEEGTVRHAFDVAGTAYHLTSQAAHASLKIGLGVPSVEVRRNYDWRKSPGPPEVLQQDWRIHVLPREPCAVQATDLF